MKTIALFMSRFPKLTETFVLNEALELERQGARVEIFSLFPHRERILHPGAERFVPRAHRFRLTSPRVWAANLRFLLRAPDRFRRAWSEALRGTWGSPRFFFGALAVLPQCAAIAERLQALGVEHVHAHFAHHPTLAALVVHRLTGIPFSFTAHGSDLHRDKRMLKEKVAAAAFAVTVSQYNRRVMLEACGREADEHIRIIHCGVDCTLVQSVPRRRAADEPMHIVCVGSLEEVKGHRFLIEACAELRARGVAFRCECAGSGHLRGELERRISHLGLEGMVRLLGPLPRPRVIELLQRADVSVLASHPTRSGKREGIPVALMEAMAAGLPVVASDLSGIPELVEDGRSGILVAPGDVHALADALERLARDAGLRARMGAAARCRVEENFDLERGVSRLLAEITLIDAEAAFAGA